MQEFPDIGMFPQEEEFLNKRILLDDGIYKVVTCLGNDAHNYTINPTTEELVDGWKTSHANGVYDFVIMPQHPGTLFVRKSNWYKRDVRERDNNIDRGHTSIARRSKVLFAGELFFGGMQHKSQSKSLSKALDPGKHEAGTLFKWSNKSGHYQIGASQSETNVRRLCEEQTKHARKLLPMNLFVPWDGEL